MCLIPKTKIKTANRSITCYKRFVTRRRTGELVSPYQATVYSLGETKEVPFFTDEVERKIKKRTDVKAINAGLHAYTTLKRATNIEFYTIARCLIPKGTKYALGSNGDIVALKLTVKEIVRD